MANGSAARPARRAPFWRFRRRRELRAARRQYVLAREESNRLVRDLLGWPSPDDKAAA